MEIKAVRAWVAIGSLQIAYGQANNGGESLKCQYELSLREIGAEISLQIMN